jgi:hypothetical protein
VASLLAPAEPLTTEPQSNEGDAGVDGPSH